MNWFFGTVIVIALLVVADLVYHTITYWKRRNELKEKNKTL